MSALMCARCDATAMPRQIAPGVLADPPGWCCITITGRPMTNVTCCPDCAATVRLTLATTPRDVEALRDTERAEDFRLGYEAGCDDTQNTRVCTCPPAAAS